MDGMAIPDFLINRWIEARWLEKDAAALTWVVQKAAFALLSCYPKDQRQEALWGVFRLTAGKAEEGGANV